MVRNSRWLEMQNMYFQEGKINLSKIGRFGYKFDTLETNWGEFELKMWKFVFSQILTYNSQTSQYSLFLLDNSTS